MTRFSVLHLAFASVALGATILVAPHVVAGQDVAGLQSNWTDLETWSHVSSDGRETELGLGLQPAGGVGIAFLARVSLRTPKTAPSVIRVQIGAGPRANPNMVRRATLVFIADAGTKDRFMADLSPMLAVDDVTPGGNLQNGIASMPVADFARLARASALTANAFGFDLTFSSDQIRAMKGFAAKLGLAE
jgi:hypothetical protein